MNLGSEYDARPQKEHPTVLFVCVHNAGRSQIAAALTQALSSGNVTVWSAGSEPADQINPVAVQVMKRSASTSRRSSRSR